MAILYFIAQMIGAVAGYGLLKALTPYSVFNENAGEYGFCATAPHADLTTFQAFMHEYVATMFLISLCCSVWDERNAKNTDSSPLKFGFAIMVLSMIFVSKFLFYILYCSKSFISGTTFFVFHKIYFVAKPNTKNE